MGLLKGFPQKLTKVTKPALALALPTPPSSLPLFPSVKPLLSSAFSFLPRESDIQPDNACEKILTEGNEGNKACPSPCSANTSFFVPFVSFCKTALMQFLRFPSVKP
jgi:hypothetical protein